MSRVGVKYFVVPCQSDKYTQATATSNKVVFTVGEATFDVKQTNATQFTINFDAPVKALATSDVTMVKRLELATGNYDYPVLVKAVALAKDGMSADVTLFDSNPFTHNTKYIISVNGYEELPFTASLGNPTRIEISAEGALGGEVLTTGKATPIVVKYFDEKDVEVEPANPTVIFRLENRSTDGSFYLAGKSLTIKKEGVAATVIAEYQGRIENGKRVGQLDTKRTFVAVNQAPVVVKDLSGKTLANGSAVDWSKASMTMRLASGTKNLWVKFRTTENKDTVDLTYGTPFKVGSTDYQVTFTALDPSVAVISNSGVVTAFKTGTASFYVNLIEKKNGVFNADDATPVAVVDVTVEAKETFAYTTIDNNGFITLGTVAASKDGQFKLSAVDSYGQAWPIKDGVTVKCTSDGFDAGYFGTAVGLPEEGAYTADGKAIIKVDAKKIYDLLAAKNQAPAAGEATMLYFSATYKNYTVDFSVMIQVPLTNEKNEFVGNYIQISASADNVDALRVNDTNKNGLKSVTFEVVEMNNGVKVGALEFASYNADASAVSEGTYCYKVTKDGKDLATTPVGNKVTVDLSTTGADANEKNIVKYDNLGAGTYEFALYRCYGDGKDAKNNVLVQEHSSVVNVYVSDAGSYYVAGDLVSNKVDVLTDDAILACFNINDRNGKAVLKKNATTGKYEQNDGTKYEMFVVSAQGKESNSGYVYIEKITFYEKVAEGVYVPYVVNVDTVLSCPVK